MSEDFKDINLHSNLHELLYKEKQILCYYLYGFGKIYKTEYDKKKFQNSLDRVEKILALLEESSGVKNE